MGAAKKILELLTPRERRRAYLLFVMVLVMAFLDMVGIAALFPLMRTLANPDLVSSNPYLSAAFGFFGFSSTRFFLVAMGVAVLAALLFSILFKTFTTYFLLRFSQMRSHSIAQRLIERYLAKPYDWYLNRHSADMGKSILMEVQQVVSGALTPLLQLTAYGTVSIALLGLLIVLTPGLALTVVLVVGTSYALIYLLLRRYLGRIGKARIEANRIRFAVVQETFGGIKEVKLGNLERVMLARFEKPSRRFSATQANAQQVAQLPRYIIEALVFCVMVGALLFFMMQEGGLEAAVPTLSVFVLASYRLMPALQQVYSHLSTLRFSSPALDSVHKDLVGAPGTVLPVRVSPEARLSLKESLRLEDVVYAYPKAASPALKGLNLEIRACTTVALVGTTGSGKTTTVDIILGLLRPQSGRLVVDGKPLDDIRAWQCNIGYVPQSIFLTDDTVAANIAFGMVEKDIDMEAVMRAAKAANLHDFVSRDLPDGYATKVGERGVRLSGGQRQRIGIARALYRDPEMLILDEATSALDNLTEQAVMDAVRNLGHRKTIILIAHRLSTVEKCDKIFLLENGGVVAQGTYDELLASNAHFAAMVRGESAA